MEYEVYVDNIGQVGQPGLTLTEAKVLAESYYNDALAGHTRADPHSFVMFDGEIVAEYGESTD